MILYGITPPKIIVYSLLHSNIQEKVSTVWLARELI